MARDPDQLAGLALRAAGLELRVATDADIEALFTIVEASIVPAGSESWMPRLLVDRAATSEARHRAFVDYHRDRRAQLSPERWHAAFAVVDPIGRVLGTQDVEAFEYASTGEVHTGSYLAASAQGRGTGSKMRAMVLEWVFGSLGAQVARSSYVDGNQASARLSATLGYQPDGQGVIEHAGSRYPEQRLVLFRDRWAQFRPDWLDDLVIVGAAAARALLIPERS
jgi:RimJ/RimL family protein N-acetyltransferase